MGFYNRNISASRMTALTTSIFFILFISFFGLDSVTASLSGIYIDNGVDQTILEKSLDTQDKMDIEHEILELLGLPDRPKKRHQQHLSLRKSAPKFLLDVYHQLNEENSGGRFERSLADNGDDENIIEEVDLQAIEESDIIMTFLSKNNHISDFRHEHGRRLKFDVSEISDDVQLLMAELKLYKNSLDNDEFSVSKAKSFVITLYSIEQLDGYEELHILASINTTSDYHGWLKLNVTDILSRWIDKPQQNRGLYIKGNSVDSPHSHVKLEEIGLVNARGDDQYQPFMVGYFKALKMMKTPSTRRVKRNVQKRRKKSEMRNPFFEPNRTINESKSCQIHTLFVQFKDLKWQDWIIAPEGYGAFYCSGVCNFPLNAHMNATNHAIVQTLVHLMTPSKVPKPCCAPTTLSAISVLYYLNEENVNLKKYKNMVVKSCGCH